MRTWVLTEQYLKKNVVKHPLNSPQIEIETKPLPAAFERALERLLSRVDELVPLQLAGFDEGLAALSADVDSRAVRVQMLPHRRIVPEHLVATFVWAGCAKKKQVRIVPNH